MYQYPKTFLSTGQLIQNLKNSGMTIDSQDEATMALTTIGYYRLKKGIVEDFSVEDAVEDIAGGSGSDECACYVESLA